MYTFFETILNGPSRYALAHHMNGGLMVLLVFGALATELSLAGLLVLLVRALIIHYRAAAYGLLRILNVGQREYPHIFLELTLPDRIEKSAYATEQLHSLLRATTAEQTTLRRLTGQTMPYSLEIVATYTEGIRYVLRIPQASRDVVERSLLSLMPGGIIGEIDDYLATIPSSTMHALELELTADFVLPLKETSLGKHDPTAFLLAHMVNMAPSELIAYQIVVTPMSQALHPTAYRHIRAIEHIIARGQSMVPQLSSKHSLIIRSFRRGIIAMVWVLNGCLSIVSTVFMTFAAPTRHTTHQPRRAVTTVPTDPYEFERGWTTKQKLDQPLSVVTIRLLVSAAYGKQTNGRLAALVSSFEAFATTQQAIRVWHGRGLLRQLIPGTHTTADQFIARVLSRHYARQPMVLSGTELAGLYHFPEIT